MNDIAQIALDMLYKAMKATKIAKANAERRNAKQDELDNLDKKIAAIDWLTEKALEGV